MTVKTFAWWYAVVSALLLMTAYTIYAAASIVLYYRYQSTARIEPSIDPPANSAEVLHQPLLSDGPVESIAPDSRLSTLSSALDEASSEPVSTVQSTSSSKDPSQPDSRDAEFDRRAKQLALKCRSATSDDARETLIGQLKALNEQHFVYRQQQRKQEIERLSSRVDSLRLSQLRRDQNKLEILSRRLKDLIDPRANLDWDDVEKTGSPETHRNSTSGTDQIDADLNTGLDTGNFKTFEDSNPRTMNLLLRDYSEDSDPVAIGLKQLIERLKQQIDQAHKRFDPQTSESYVKKYQQQLVEAKDKLGERIKRIESLKSQPQFEGLTLSAWLDVLKTERSLAKINTALIAISHLTDEADPQLLVSTIVRMAQSQSKLKVAFPQVDITPQVDRILYSLPGEIVVSVLIKQLKQLPPRAPSDGLKRLITSVFAGSTDLAPCGSEYCEEYLELRGSNALATSLRRAIRPDSGQFVRTLAQIAENDHLHDDWAVETSFYILELSEQILAHYPELIPVVERVFSESPLKRLQERSAALLCESGLQSDAIVDFFRKRLQQERRSRNVFDFQFLVDLVVKMGRTSPRFIDLMEEELAERYSHDPGGVNGVDLAEKQILIAGFGQLGDPARSKLPLLREYENNPTSALSLLVFRPRFMQTMNHPKFKDLIAYVIQQIQDAKPRPQPQPLPEEGQDPFTEKPLETSLPSGTTGPLTVAPKAEVEHKKEAAPKAGTMPVAEKTFDGVPYSQWLKMLETERKPEKLATSIDACSRLAEPDDEFRIARGVFRAASLFENADSNEQFRVWQAARAGLQRLPAEVVVYAQIEALRDEASYRAGRGFQGDFLFQTALPKEKAILPRADELVNLLMKRFHEGGKGANDLFASASAVWACSDRPLTDFPELNAMILKAVDDGPIYDLSNLNVRESDQVPREWRIAIRNLIEKHPDTPDLALNLARHLGKSREVAECIGHLGSRAEPAVPQLVEHFLKEWKPLESKFRNEPDWKAWSKLGRMSPEDERRHLQRCSAVVEALGRIGSGPKGSALLRQLKFMSPSLERSFDSNWTEKLETAWLAVATNPPLENSENLLSDFSLMKGRWTLRSQFPTKEYPSTSAVLDGTWFEIGDRGQIEMDFDGTEIFNFAGWWPSWRYEINETKNPKRISIFKVETRHGDRTVREKPDSRHFGIYELTETTLQCQFAKVGETVPTELVKEAGQLPEGHVLLMFDRTLEMPSDLNKE